MPKLLVNLAGALPPQIEPGVIQTVTKQINQTADLPNKAGIINLRLVDDQWIATLNKKYAGVSGPTDVLSFPYQGAGYRVRDKDNELGDMVISLETAYRQAQAAGTSLTDEVATLLTHGILHLLGLDHKTKQQQQRIDALQEDIIKRSGLTYRTIEWQ